MELETADPSDPSGRRPSSVGYDVRGYSVEMSTGRDGSGSEGGMCSDEFVSVDYVVAQGERGGGAAAEKRTPRSTVSGLTPDTPFCVRVVAASDGGISARSDALEIVTPPYPVNSWRAVTPRVRDHFDATTPCAQHPHPMSRRGHTLNVVAGRVYLFGGLTGEGCVCDDADAVFAEGAESVVIDGRQCYVGPLYANDLWRLDPSTMVWRRLRPLAPLSLSPTDPMGGRPRRPPGREQHSLTVLPNGNLLLIGGRTRAEETAAGSGPVFLGDVWELNPGRTTSHVVQGGGVVPRAGGSLIGLVDGNVLLHRIDVTIPRDDMTGRGELCVKNVKVEVVLEVECAERIGYVSLFGPGPKTLSPDHLPPGRGQEVKVRRSANVVRVYTCYTLSMIPL